MSSTLLRHLLALFVASSLLSACPDSGLEPLDDAGAASRGTGDGAPDGGEADGPDTSFGEDVGLVTQGLTLSLSPVDLGLGGEPGEPRELELSGARVLAGRLEWPAGAWRLSWVRDGVTWGPSAGRVTGLRRDAEEFVELDAPSDAAVLFNAADEPVRVEVDLDAGTLTIARDVTEASFSGEWPRARAGAGALVDDGIFAVNTAGGDSTAEAGALAGALASSGLGPVRSSRGALVLAPAFPTASAPRIRGSFNGWAEAGEILMAPLSRGLYGAFMPIPDARVSYKIVYDEDAAWVPDGSNPFIEWDGIQDQGVGDFNSVLLPGSPDGSPRLFRLREVDSPQLENTRDVYVWTPAAYDVDLERRFATLYLHDGNESLSRSQFDGVATEWEKGGKSPPLLVFVHLPTQDVRIAEYTFGTDDARGDLYSEFLASTLVRRVDASWRTRAERGARGLAGASLGGLISYHVASQNPDVFEYTAGMSSSFWWEDEAMVARVRSLGCQDLTYYLDSGSPGDGVEGTRAMRDALDALGCEFSHVEEAGASHDWFFWKRRFPGVLDAFLTVYENE